MNRLEWLMDRKMEERYAIIALMIAVLYFLSNVVISLSRVRINVITYISIGLTIACSLLLYFLIKGKHRNNIVKLFAFLVMGAFCMVLPLTSGQAGGISYNFQVLSVTMILLSQGRMKLVVGMILATIVIVVQSGLISFQGFIEPTSLYIDFMLNLFFISLIMYSFKGNMDGEERTLLKRNMELRALNEALKNQREELEASKMETEVMRNNLQNEVINRTRLLEEENKRLLEYSFINAHLVRAPIANLLAITQINDEDPDLKELKEGIEEMDLIVRKIAGVIQISDIDPLKRK